MQCGVGRTGKLFAYEWSGVSPDIMTIAKAIGNGFPLGACLTSKEVGGKMDFGSHGSTFGGNPLACTVGNAVLDIMLKDKFFSEINVVAKKLYEGLQNVITDFPSVIENVRGRGFILGLKCKIENDKFVNLAREKYILTVKAVSYTHLTLPTN